jgi:hypothetical protein
VAGLELAVAEFGRGEGAEGDEIGGGAGVDEGGGTDSEEPGQLALEVLGEAAGGEPGIERGIDDGADVVGPDHLAGDLNAGLTGDELSYGEGLCVILGR